MDPLYDVCFAGEILENQELSAVRLKLARLFKAEEATLDKLFSGTTQIVKRGCDRETALKYKKAMEQAGAKPIVRANPQDESSPAATGAGEAASAAERIARLAGAPDVAPGGPVSASASSEQGSPPQETAGDMTVAPPGSDVLRPEERASESSAEIDTSAIELMESGVDLSDGRGEAPPAPDTSHLSMGAVGDDIPTLASGAEPLSPDISGIALSPANSDFSDCAPPPAAAPDLDLSSLDLAPSGADMLEEAYRPQEDAEAPATDHLELDEDTDPKSG
jgi:hypothetical protein